MSKAVLRVTHDGIRSNCYVVYDNKSAHLDIVIDAALQADVELAEKYRQILSAIAHHFYIIIRKEIDGSSDCGCCWYAVELMYGINGDTLTTRPHRLTKKEFGGWSPSNDQILLEKKAILLRAVEIGLGSAEYWVGGDRTVVAVLNHW